MNKRTRSESYFPYEIQIAQEVWQGLKPEFETLRRHAPKLPPMMAYRTIAAHLNKRTEAQGRWVPAGDLNLYALLSKIFRYITDSYLDEQHPALLEQALVMAEFSYPSSGFSSVAGSFCGLFPNADMVAGTESPASYLAGDTVGNSRKKMVVKELLLLTLAGENRAIDNFRILLDDAPLAAAAPYRSLVTSLDRQLATAPPFQSLALPLMELLRAPLRACPDSLAGQMEFIKSNWTAILPTEILSEILTAFDIITEEQREYWGPTGPPEVLEFGFGVGGKEGNQGSSAADDVYPEPEAFSQDADWMSNVVLLAKMVYVWLDQLTKKYGRPINRLDEIPDWELDRLQRWGFTGLWLIGIWERSPASQKIKHLCGNHDAVASAYSLYDYVVAADLGGQPALERFRDKCRRRGIRLSADMVPNHTGIYSRWVQEHPDWFVQLDYSPYPNYTFDGPDLSSASHISINIEDGYWRRTDAGVVFKHYDHHTGRTRYIYHGNDGTSTPWNDTAQLNYLIPEVREAVIQTIIHVARNFPIIRFDAAMTLAKKHFQRLWFPQPGGGGGVPSRAEHAMSREEFDRVFPVEFWREVVDRVAAEVPDTLLLAEAFWLMEGYFVRTLGMHRVYNSAFMNMLKMEENAKYRQTVKNVLEFNPEVLKRFVNFMNNPDERTAVEQFGKEGKYIGAAVLLVTMPGLPMVGHGQVEGFHEKYGMEYRRAYWDEAPDEHLIKLHEEKIFPLMKRRWLFSGAENFVFYDFWNNGQVDENVFAYSNRVGNERGIILYNNRFGDTAGWINVSTAIGVKNGAGDTVLIRKNLGEALTFNGDGRHYYLFRDAATGLEYLRHGAELVEKGLFVELTGYEYHAFLDFREIWDDEYGNWGKLCHRLGNRPVPSMADELKLVQYENVVVPFGTLITTLLPVLDDCLMGEADDAQEQEARALVAEQALIFYQAVAQHSGNVFDCRVGVQQLLDDLDEIRTIALGQGAPGTHGEVLLYACGPLGSPAGRACIFISRLLQRMGGVRENGETTAQLFHRFGLKQVAVGLLGTLERCAGEPLPRGEGREGALLEILVNHAGYFTQWDDALCASRTRALLGDGGVRSFLLIHESGGETWFNKERLECLFQWLFLVEMSGDLAGRDDPEHLQVRMALLYKVVEEINTAAEKSSYRPQKFLTLLEKAEV
jgi:glycosidase